jgi:hypothetical protein
MPKLGKITGWPPCFSRALTSASVSRRSPARKNPAEVEADRLGSGAPGASHGLGDGFDLDLAGALQEVGRLVVELDGEEPLPGGQDHLQKIGDFDERLEHVDARLLLILEVRFARVGREADQFGALRRRDVAVAPGMGVGAQGGDAGLAVAFEPDGLEGKSDAPGLENQEEGAAGAGGGPGRPGRGRWGRHGGRSVAHGEALGDRRGGGALAVSVPGRIRGGAGGGVPPAAARFRRRPVPQFHACPRRPAHGRVPDPSKRNARSGVRRSIR